MRLLSPFEAGAPRFLLIDRSGRVQKVAEFADERHLPTATFAEKGELTMIFPRGKGVEAPEYLEVAQGAQVAVWKILPDRPSGPAQFDLQQEPDRPQWSLPARE